ncbi:MAG: conjugal transfer protein TraF [Alphaproteobacteria bacterium]|nr:conjugal transfer protein TraF [Alphaproteobacteria bacterium]
MGITHVPAFIALHPRSGKFIPLAYGMVSENGIKERIELLVRIQAGDFKK